MSARQRIVSGSEAMWRYLVAGAIDKKWMPIAVIGSVREGDKFVAGIAKAKQLPSGVLLEVLRQIVSELEREEAGNGQRVS